jgi:O-antigen/teichoic acid export membrane protein
MPIARLQNLRNAIFAQENCSVPRYSARSAGNGFAWSAFWSMVGNVSLRLSQAAILIALAKLGGTVAVGAYALAVAACNPLMLFSYLQLGSILAADVKGKYPFAYYRQLRVFLCGFSVASIIIFSYCFGASHAQMLVIVALAVAKFFEGLSDIRYGLFKRVDRMDLLALTQCIRSLVTLVAFVITYAQTRDVFWSVVALGISSAVCLLLVDSPLAKKVMLPSDLVTSVGSWAGYDREALRPLLLSAFPLGIISLVISIYAYFPQYLIESRWGESQLGIFVAIAALPVVLETAARSVAQATIPRFASYYHQKDLVGFSRLYRRSLLVYAGLGVVGVLLAGLLGERLLALVFGGEIAAHYTLLLIVSAAAACSFLCSYASIFVAMKQYRAFLQVWCLGLLSLVFLGGLLIPFYGVYGAGWAVLVANLIRIALVHHSIYKLLNSAFQQDLIEQNPSAQRARLAA